MATLVTDPLRPVDIEQGSLIDRALKVVRSAKEDGRLSEGDVLVLTDLILHPDLPRHIWVEHWRNPVFNKRIAKRIAKRG